MCFLLNLNWEVIVGIIGGAIIPSVIYLFQRQSDKIQKKNNEEQKLKSDIEYFNVMLKSIVSEMKEQAYYFKKYSEGFNGSLFGKTGLELNTFYSLDVFMKINHYNFHKAFIYRYSKEDRTKVLTDFDGIFNNLSEFRSIYKLSNKSFLHFIKIFQAENCKKFDFLYLEDFQKSIYKYKFNFSNENLKNNLMRIMEQHQLDLSKLATGDVGFKEIRENEYRIIKETAALVKEEIAKSGEHVNDELVNKIFFVCIDLIRLYEKFESKSNDMKVVFEISYNETIVRVDNLLECVNK